MLMPPLSGSAEQALRTLARISGAPRLADLHGHELLMERARLLGLTFRHRQSPGGFCRLLNARDGVMAANLPRESDWELLPAWLETDPGLVDTWDKLAQVVLLKPTAELQERARLLGIAAAAATAPASPAPPFYRIDGPALPPVERAAVLSRPPRVVDLSALWAGPLCAHLLQLCGAEVIKVESRQRPDGAREGNARFFALLNQGKRSVALDLRRDDGRRALQRLLASADIVIEASRPRALRQLGIEAERLLQENPALTWVSITGYGRDEPQGNWVAFGDDAGVAAGLSQVMADATGDFQVAGDAIADPLTGIHAALAAWRSWQSGRGRLISLALADVAAASHAAELADLGKSGLNRVFADLWKSVRGHRLGASCVRPPQHPVRPLGADTASVLAEVAEPC